MSIYAEKRLADALGVPAINIVRPDSPSRLKPNAEAFLKAANGTPWSPIMVADTEPVQPPYDDGTGGAWKIKDDIRPTITATHMLLSAISQSHGRPTQCLLYGGPLFDCNFALADALMEIRPRVCGACYTMDWSWCKVSMVPDQLDLYASAAAVMGISRAQTWVCLHPYGKDAPSHEKQAWLLAAAMMIERQGMNVLLVNPTTADPTPWLPICRQIVRLAQ